MPNKKKSGDREKQTAVTGTDQTKRGRLVLKLSGRGFYIDTIVVMKLMAP